MILTILLFIPTILTHTSINPQFVINDLNNNNIKFPKNVLFYQTINCSNQLFYFVENQYQLYPSYTFQHNHLLPRIYKHDFKHACYILNHQQQCTLITKDIRLLIQTHKGFKFNYMLSYKDRFIYQYNCSHHCNNSTQCKLPHIIPVHGLFALNLLIHTQTIHATIDNCSYQTYSHNPLVNYAKSFINYFTRNSNYKCFIYHNYVK